MTRVVCNFLRDVSSARSRNRMQQWEAKVVPCKLAKRGHRLVMPQAHHAYTCVKHDNVEYIIKVSCLKKQKRQQRLSLTSNNRELISTDVCEPRTATGS